MERVDDLRSRFWGLKGKVIAVVYVFEGDVTEGYQHYDPWKSDVIADWLSAIQEIQCLPFIIDVRTFCEKVFNRTLPVIDYVINLNAGTTDLSVLGLVPSICAFLHIPCIPANAISTIVGENKKISNLVAKAQGCIVPRDLQPAEPSGIFRPANLGSSCGVQLGFPQEIFTNDYLYQEFIPGFDMTIPVLYNPLIDQLDILPAIMYYPSSKDIYWYLGETEKALHKGYTKKAILLSDNVKMHFKSMAASFGISTFCRFDTRVECRSNTELDKLITGEIALERIYFIEINPLPTIKNQINFHTAFQALDATSSFWPCIQAYTDVFHANGFVGFLLSCAILSLKAKR